MDVTNIPLLGDNGYPSEAELEVIRTWSGTVQELVDFITPRMRGGFVKIEDAPAHWGDGLVKKLSLVSGGWSGAESVMGALSHQTVFHLRFWELSQRGGLDVYHIPLKYWESDEASWLGMFGRMPEPADAETD